MYLPTYLPTYFLYTYPTSSSFEIAALYKGRPFPSHLQQENKQASKQKAC